jgi:hypothetical protein
MMNAKDPSVSSPTFLSVLTTLTILYTWAIVSIWTRVICDIPIGVYTFAGIIILGRIGNKYVERPTANTSVETETKTKSVTGEMQ